jgi:mRNA-degrading endonuclease RelE of RelBE toxin-antitoxin system
MTVWLTPEAKKQLQKLPKNIQEKARKSFHLLAEDPYHPSLNSKRMKGFDRFEARIDYHYRLTYIVERDNIYILSVGPHDEGLGKK